MCTATVLSTCCGLLLPPPPPPAPSPLRSFPRLEGFCPPGVFSESGSGGGGFVWNRPIVTHRSLTEMVLQKKKEKRKRKKRLRVPRVYPERRASVHHRHPTKCVISLGTITQGHITLTQHTHTHSHIHARARTHTTPHTAHTESDLL